MTMDKICAGDLYPLEVGQDHGQGLYPLEVGQDHGHGLCRRSVSCRGRSGVQALV